MPSVLECLHYGKRNAVTRMQLHFATEMNDRLIRDEITKLRNKGYPIFNSGDGDGYYLATPEDEADMRQSIMRERARAISVSMNVKTQERLMQKVLHPEGLQMEL